MQGAADPTTRFARLACFPGIRAAGLARKINLIRLQSDIWVFQPTYKFEVIFAVSDGRIPLLEAPFAVELYHPKGTTR
jgi:hypothetical protein